MKKVILLSLFIFTITSAAKNNKEIKISFIGDSLTAGYGIQKEQAFPAVIKRLLAQKGHKIRAINAGISGSTSASAIRRVKWQLKGKPNIIVLALGANDGLRGLPQKSTKENLIQSIQMAKKSKIKVLLLGMKVPPNYGEKYRKEFDAIFPEVAKKTKIPLVPFMLKGVAGQKKFNIEDGIHPNPEGHQKIAKVILPYLLELL